MSKQNKAIYSITAVMLTFSMVLSMFMFSIPVKAAILGPKIYYLSVEKSNFKKLESDFREKMKKSYSREASYAWKSNIAIGGDAVKSDPDMQKFADLFSKFEFAAKYNINYNFPDIRNGYYEALFSAKYDSKPLIDTDIKSADKKAVISFPGLTEKTLGMEIQDISYTMNEALLGDDLAFKKVFGITRDTYDDMVERYLKDVIAAQIPDANVVFNENVSFKSISCNSITFKIDEKISADIYRAVAKEVEKDKDLKTLLYSLAKVVKETSTIDETFGNALTEKEIDKDIKGFCEDLIDEADTMEDVQVEYTAYFSNSGDILSRQVCDKLSGSEVSFSSYKNSSGMDMLNFSCKEDGESRFEFNNKLRFVGGSVFGGDIDFSVDGKTFMNAQYTYDKTGKVGGIDAFIGDVNGKFYLNNLVGEQLSDDSGLSDMIFSFTNKKKDDNTLEGNAKFATKVDGKSLDVTVMTELKQSDKAGEKPQVSIDKSINTKDSEAMRELTEELTNALAKRLSSVIPKFLDYNDSEEF